MDTHAPNIEALLTHSEWVRALARRLVIDDASADDVVQEVWAAALAADTLPHSPRAWLAAIVRKRVLHRRRTSANRKAREDRAASTEALPSVQDVAARAELERMLVNRVQRLPAGQRDVLLLRFFEGHPPREIAQILQLPVATVHTRTARALASLRQDLDQQFEDRTTWQMAFLPLASPRNGTFTLLSASSVPLFGGLAMKLIVVAASAALLALSVAYWAFGKTVSTPILFQSAPLENALARVPQHRSPQDFARDLDGGLGSTRRSAELALASPSIRGVVVDLEGRGIPAVQVLRGSPMERRLSTEHQGMSAALWTTVTDAEGAFEFLLGGGEPYRIDAPEHQDYCAELGYSTWPAGAEARIVMRPLIDITLDVEVLDSVTGAAARLFYLSAYSSWGKSSMPGVVVVGDPERRMLRLLDLDQESGNGLRCTEGRVQIGVRAAQGVPIVVSVSPVGFHANADGSFDMDSVRREWVPTAGEVGRLLFEPDLSGPEQRATERIEGLVRERATGNVLRGVTLSLGERGVSSNAPLARRRVASDSAGRFALACDAEWDELDLEVDAPGYDFERLHPQRGEELVVDLVRRGGLHVEVQDNAGLPLSGVHYLFVGEPTGARSRLYERGETDAQGRVDFNALRRGSYSFYLLPSSHAADEQALDSWSFDIESGQRREAICTLDPPDLVEVFGALLGAAGGAQDLLPTFLGLEGTEGYATAQATGAGGYRAGGLQRGAYFVLLFPANDGRGVAGGARLFGVVQVEEFSRQVLDLPLSSGVLRGRVTGANGLRAVLVPELAEYGPRLSALFASKKWGELFGVVLGESGEYSFEGVPDGAYRLEIRDAQLVRMARPVELQGDRDMGVWPLE